MTKAYPSNLTHTQYEFLSDMIPEAKHPLTLLRSQLQLFELAY